MLSYLREVLFMKEKYILNPVSRRILHIGLAIVSLAFFFVMLHVYNTSENGVIVMSNVYTMIEHVSMTLLMVVTAALLLDIHVKTEK